MFSVSALSEYLELRANKGLTNYLFILFLNNNNMLERYYIDCNVIDRVSEETESQSVA